MHRVGAHAGRDHGVVKQRAGEIVVEVLPLAGLRRLDLDVEPARVLRLDESAHRRAQFLRRVETTLLVAAVFSPAPLRLVDGREHDLRESELLCVVFGEIEQVSGEVRARLGFVAQVGAAVLAALQAQTDYTGDGLMAPRNPPAKTLGECFLVATVRDGQWARLDPPTPGSFVNC